MSKDELESNLCSFCRKPKATLRCEICQEPLCRSCEQFLPADRFSFLGKIPEALQFSHYCPSCFDAKVAPELEEYDQTMEKARSVYVFFTTQKKPPALLKRAKERISVESCQDRDETILRLAFRAAALGYNSIIETEIRSRKARNEGYQTTVWSGEAMPAELDVERFERRS